MYLSNNLQLLASNIKWRNLFMIIALISVPTNLILTIYLQSHQTTTIILPSLISGSYKITNKTLSNSYIEDMARDVVTTMLNRSPHNISYVNETILKMADPENYGRLKEELTRVGDDLVKRRLSTIFYPTIIEVDNEKLLAKISGNFCSYIGTIQTSCESKIYSIGFSYHGSKFHLLSFREIALKDKKHEQK